jgi:hypothetical protein
VCKACEQIERNQKKNRDRPRAIIESRAKTAARRAGVPFEFFWINLNYQSMVPKFAAMMTPEALCISCGEEFLNERDIQIEHREPPRFQKDWANLHARNTDLICGSCNSGKGKKPYQQWLDDEETKRLSNESAKGIISFKCEEIVEHQIDMFELLPK